MNIDFPESRSVWGPAMHINEHRFPGKQVCVYIYRLVKQYAPYYMVPKRKSV